MNLLIVLISRILLIWILVESSTTTLFKTAEARAVHYERRDASTVPISDVAVQELEVGMTPDEKTRFEHDVHELEHAIEDEIAHKEEEIRTGHLEEVSPEKLDKEVTEHNEKKPWYVRLGRFLKTSLHDFVKHTAKRVVNDILIPAITNKILGA